MGNCQTRLCQKRGLTLWRARNHPGRLLFRSDIGFSADKGRTWSTPVRTDFPDAIEQLDPRVLRERY